jgi:hypothetical protein
VFASIFKFININMFASLKNKFSNYRTCLLRFEIHFPTIECVRFASILKVFSINMFASFRNKFSNYRTCSLCFDIEKNIIIEAFASLPFASLTPRINDTESRRLPASVIRGVVDSAYRDTGSRYSKKISLASIFSTLNG